MGLSPILSLKGAEINKNTPTILSSASKNIEEENINFEDVLENIRILLHYIRKIRKKRMKNRPQENKIITAFLLIVLSIFFASKSTCAQTWTQTREQVKENTQQIQNVERRIIDLKDNYKLLYDGAKNQNDQLGNQISFAGYLLGAFSLIFAVLGMFLAWYINRQYERIKEMKDVVESTKKYIDEHSKELYKKIKREETLELLSRLKDVPEDIGNICPLLLSRELWEEDYNYVKESYFKMKNTQGRGVEENQYIGLIMQHFPYQSLKDVDLKSEIISQIDSSQLRVMFNRDIKNFFDQVFRYLQEFGMNNEQNKTIIKNLFYHYYHSKFKANLELQDSIKESIAKHKLSISDISIIAKDEAPTDAVYVNWLNLFFHNL